MKYLYRVDFFPKYHSMVTSCPCETREEAQAMFDRFHAMASDDMQKQGTVLNLKSLGNDLCLIVADFSTCVIVDVAEITKWRSEDELEFRRAAAETAHTLDAEEAAYRAALSAPKASEADKA